MYVCMCACVCAMGMLQAGVPVAKLKRKRSLTVALDDHVERFKALMHIYTEMDGTPAVMSDLTSTADVMRRHPLMSTCAPALHFIAIMGKVGPFKSAVGEKWSRVFKGRDTESVCPKRWRVQSLLSGVSLRSLQHVEAEDLTHADIGAMLQIMQAAAAATDTQDTSEWQRHVLHNNCFWSGWQLLMTRFFGVMEATGNGLALPPHPELQSKKVYDKMRAAHAAGLALYKSAVPRTLGEYAAMAEPLQSLLSMLHPPSLNPEGDYSIPWCIRSHSIAEMRVRGIDRCQVPSDMTVTTFSQCFPDSGDWLTKLAKVHDVTLVHELLDLFEYTHPAELFAMFCCIFGEKSLLSYDVRFLQQHSAKIRKIRIELQQHILLTPVPAVALSEYMKEHQEAGTAGKAAKKA